MMEDIDEDSFTLCSPVVADCGRSLTCERIHFKGNREGLAILDLSCNLDGEGECPYYKPREALLDEGKVFRGGLKRHNKHAPPSRLHSSRPNLMVKRHIKKGHNLNDY